MICRRAKRPTASSKVAALATLLALHATLVVAEEPHAPATPAPAQPAPASAPTPAPEPDPAPAAADAEVTPDEAAIPAELRTELHGYTQLAREAAEQERWQLVDHFLELLTALAIPDAAKKSSFGEIAEAFVKKNQRAKAIAMYEKMAELYAETPDSPGLLFRAAELYRESGAYGRAIARFYSVLNSALKVRDPDIEAYRVLTRRAQIEIAETHFLARDYEQSRKFCDLALRLDLPPDQRARLQFRLLHCQFVLGDSNGAITAAEQFLKDFPDDPNAPECRYLLASALRTVDRRKEALEAVLALLRVENARKQQNLERWTYWQKKTGNEFANDYYQRADFLNALTIYQTLAKLSEEPDWQWPVIYQIGLCFERLRLVARAAEAFKYIIEHSEKNDPTRPPISESTRNLVQMARWRGEQLAWSHTTETHLQRLLGEPLQAPEAAALEPTNPTASSTP